MNVLSDKSQLLSPLLHTLHAIRPLSASLESALVAGFDSHVIPKGQIMLYEGEICKNLWFLADGLLRSFHHIGDKETTSRIMFTNHIVISPGSFFKQAPATETIEALTESVVLTLPYHTLQHIYEKFPEFNYHTRLITEEYFYKQEQRLYMLRKHNAADKYAFFLENYGDYLKEIPQKYIASFLNIAPETLSRTRNKFSKK